MNVLLGTLLKPRQQSREPVQPGPLLCPPTGVPNMSFSAHMLLHAGHLYPFKWGTWFMLFSLPEALANIRWPVHIYHINEHSVVLNKGVCNPDYVLNETNRRMPKSVDRREKQAEFIGLKSPQNIQSGELVCRKLTDFCPVSPKL